MFKSIFKIILLLSFCFSQDRRQYQRRRQHRYQRQRNHFFENHILLFLCNA